MPRRAQQRLAVVAGKLLERQRVTNARADAEQPGVSEQVEPPDAGDHRDRRDHDPDRGSRQGARVATPHRGRLGSRRDWHDR
jgi:hypothetical protein